MWTTRNKMVIERVYLRQASDSTINSLFSCDTGTLFLGSGIVTGLAT